MSHGKAKIKRVRLRQRKDPLDNLETLNRLGRIASRNARKRALENGAVVTYAKKGITYQLNADGIVKIIKKEHKAFPTIEEDLCQG
ncbi:MAG: hypothetical protein QNK37_26185 [Acidobacteriota bacterium]|nr:hypothetical protein [Acidobacteriota bacterium]